MFITMAIKHMLFVLLSIIFVGNIALAYEYTAEHYFSYKTGKGTW